MTARLHVLREDEFRPRTEISDTEPADLRRTAAELPPPGRLLLRVIRLLAENQGNWAVVQQELWICCGLAAVETALQALEETLAILAREGRRPLRVKPSEAKRMTADEQAILALVAAAQTGDVPRLAAHARWLVRPLAQGPLMTQATRLAQGLARAHHASSAA